VRNWKGGGWAANGGDAMEASGASGAIGATAEAAAAAEAAATEAAYAGDPSRCAVKRLVCGEFELNWLW